MFFIVLLKQVNSFLTEKNICVILCELLNKDYYYYYYYYYTFTLIRGKVIQKNRGLKLTSIRLPVP